MGLSHLNSYLYSASFKKLRKSTANPFLKNTIVSGMQYKKLWGETRQLWGVTQSGVMITSPWQKKNMGFKAWLNMGIVKLLDIYEDYNLMTFNGIKAKFDVPQKHFFRYLPFRSFILVHLKNSVQQPPFSILETYVLKKKCVKRLFFQFQNILAGHHNDDSESKGQEWMRDLNNLTSSAALENLTYIV